MASVTAEPADPGRRPARRTRGRTLGGAVLGAVALIMAIVGVTRTATAQNGSDDPVAIEFGMGLVAPGAYVHSSGGGTWADTVNEVQWIGNYECGDVVSYILTVTHDPTAGGLGGPRTAEIDLEFAAGANGIPGVGLTDILDVHGPRRRPGRGGRRQQQRHVAGRVPRRPYTTGGDAERHRTGRPARLR